MNKEFLLAISQLAAEKNLSRDVVLHAVESALATAYKREGDNAPAVYVRINTDNGELHAYNQKTVAEEVEDPSVEITIEEARRYKTDAVPGDVLDFEMKLPENAGRIAAQTAKQVVLQKLREAERDAVFQEYHGREGEIMVATVQRIEARQATVELPKGTEAILPGSEQVRSEHLRAAQRLKVILLEVKREQRGPQVIVSRSHRLLLRRLFEMEVPEISAGTVEIKSIAREGGHRSKVAVHSRVASIDPIGACVGMRGSRIQAFVNELGGERIDVIKWDPDPAKFVANALSPANVIDVVIDLDERRASVTVPDRMLSLAIGKEGQNARLAAKLTGWGIDIRSELAAASGEQVTTFVPFQPGETPDIDIIQEAEEVAAAAELAAVSARPITLSPEAEEAAQLERAAALAANPERREDDVSFAAALANMPVPGREERESEDYGEEDEEEYEIPTVLAPDLRPSAIRFAEDVLPNRPVEEDPKKAAAKRPRRGPRFSEEEEDDEEQVDYRIH